MENKTGAESPQSVTIQFYYKGFSILLTKRDPDVEVKPLLENAKVAIDWAIANNMQPSWNQETNKSAQETTRVKNNTLWQEEDKPLTNLGKCPRCGGPNAWSVKKKKVYCKNLCWKKE